MHLVLFFRPQEQQGCKPHVVNISHQILKKKQCNNQPIFPITCTTIPRMIPIIADDGAYNDVGHHWGGMEEQLVGESQNNVICGVKMN
jgi:hypothetical protein